MNLKNVLLILIWAMLKIQNELNNGNNKYNNLKTIQLILIDFILQNNNIL